ncbi:MAG: hypothetical protein LBI85_05265 [Spirochaetaceae bacterium]|jgi:uncharacterized membrane protein YcgQ (UPF0703/DUF1980 family)|nr:hypothetical protein [Spirochaetaceae bacterium]
MKKAKSKIERLKWRKVSVSGASPLVFAVLACALFASGCKSKAGLAYGSLSGNFSQALPESSRTESGPPPAAQTPPHSLPPVQIPEGNFVEIKEKMFIAQTNDVYLNPDDYLGKGIRLEGLFKREGYTEKEYCFVIRYGPGCCGTDGNAGFEVAWEGQGEYPKVDEWVEATGVLKTYDEDGYPYLYIALSSLTVMDQRGAEFVTQ